MATTETFSLVYDITKEDENDILLFSTILRLPRQVIIDKILKYGEEEGVINRGTFRDLLLTYFVLEITSEPVLYQKYKELGGELDVENVLPPPEETLTRESS